MDSLLNLCTEIKNCKRCDLQYSRKNPVCGFGRPFPKIMIIGEAPGSKEDEVGKPFVGRSGKVLTLAMEKAGMMTHEVYLTNSVKCRPKVGRTPKISEIKACSTHLRLELETIRPRLVVPMGNSAINSISNILDRKLGRISEVNNKVFHCERYYIIPQYHPAAILRNPKKMEMFKDSFAKIAAFLDDIETKKMEYIFKRYTVQSI